jgi:hypothetical protein
MATLTPKIFCGPFVVTLNKAETPSTVAVLKASIGPYNIGFGKNVIEARKIEACFDVWKCDMLTNNWKKNIA